MKISKGRILYANDMVQYKAIGYSIFKSNNCGESWFKYTSIGQNIFEKICINIPILKRILRKGIYKMIPYKNDFIIFSNKNIYRLCANNRSLTYIGSVEGSRPLYPCVYNNALFYGEYRGNVQRTPILIHKYDFETSKWNVCYKFKNIRHIHGIFCDPYTQRLWVATGDLDDECNLYYSDDCFKEIHKFVGGNQKYRAIFIHFTRDTIIYGTDAPDEKNYIIELSKKSGHVIKKTPVCGPVFYGAVSGGTLLLSTVVEPSLVNEQKYMEILCLTDNLWKIIKRVKKDFLPKKLFQYGQIIFPEGPGLSGQLIYTPIAGKYHEQVIYSDLVLNNE